MNSEDLPFPPWKVFLLPKPEVGAKFIGVKGKEGARVAQRDILITLALVHRKTVICEGCQRIYLRHLNPIPCECGSFHTSSNLLEILEVLSDLAALDSQRFFDAYGCEVLDPRKEKERMEEMMGSEGLNLEFAGPETPSSEQQPPPLPTVDEFWEISNEQEWALSDEDREEELDLAGLIAVSGAPGYKYLEEIYPADVLSAYKDDYDE